jgi:orotate phosphoribosyltransferase
MTCVKSDLARAIYEVAHLTGSFKLRSGTVSSEYFDKFQFTSRPELLHAVSAAMAAIVPPDVEVLAGLQLGGVPLAAALALETGLPAVYVRLQRKSYATQKIAEGVGVDGRVVAIVEDVVSTGGQIALSAQDLRDEGADVRYALAVVDRETGGSENLAAAGIDYRFLITARELEVAAQT